MKNGTSLEKLKNLVSEAATIGINYDYELRPVKTAISAAEAWISENKELLQNTGLLKDPKTKIDDPSEESTATMEVVEAEKEQDRLYSLEELEQLQIAANQLPTTFPALK